MEAICKDQQGMKELPLFRLLGLLNALFDQRNAGILLPDA
jgi:hypothetical protein